MDVLIVSLNIGLGVAAWLYGKKEKSKILYTTAAIFFAAGLVSATSWLA